MLAGDLFVDFDISYQLPPNSEGSAELCEAIGACVRTQVRIIFRFCSNLPLSSANADTLAKAKRLTHFYSVALLLEKWFACFPTSGDGLRLAFYRFMATIK